MSDLFDKRYRFINNLGAGGFGRVFLAEEEKSKHLVAIKQLNSQDKKRQEAIIHEMQIIAQFNQPNIVAYNHYFVQDDLLYIVMEYCPLGSLRSMIKKQKITSAFVWKWMILQIINYSKI